MAELLGVRKTQTTPYHPQSDGQVERFNRTLAAMLSAVVEPDQRDWDLHLPYVTAAYRATRHPATGFSPNFLVFGREVTLPVDVMYGPPPGETSQEVGPYAADVRTKLQGAFQAAFARLNRVADRQKQRYDQQVHVSTFKEGDAAWMFSPVKTVGKSPKLQRWWTGPWVVQEVVVPGVYRMKWGQKKKVVHGDLLKPARGEVRISAVLTVPEPRGPIEWEGPTSLGSVSCGDARRKDATGASTLVKSTGLDNTMARETRSLLIWRRRREESRKRQERAKRHQWLKNVTWIRRYVGNDNGGCESLGQQTDDRGRAGGAGSAGTGSDSKRHT